MSGIYVPTICIYRERTKCRYRKSISESYSQQPLISIRLSCSHALLSARLSLSFYLCRMFFFSLFSPSLMSYSAQVFTLMELTSTLDLFRPRHKTILTTPCLLSTLHLRARHNYVFYFENFFNRYSRLKPPRAVIPHCRVYNYHM